MPSHAAVWEHVYQNVNQVAHGFLLFGSAVVFRAIVIALTADPTDTDATSVVAFSVSARHVDITPCFNSTVALDYEMVSDSFPAKTFVKFVNPLGTDVHTFIGV